MPLTLKDVDATIARCKSKLVNMEARRKGLERKITEMEETRKRILAAREMMH